MEQPPPRIFSGSRKGRKHSDPQDALGIRCLADGRYWLAVADGVSAHRLSGSVARWVVKDWLSRGMESASLGDYLECVHRDLVDEFGDFADILNSCVSISLAEISATTAHVYWLGDSPVFHTFGCEAGTTAARRITNSHADSHGRLTRYLCGSRVFEFSQALVELHHTDVVFLTTDGLVVDEAILSSAVSLGITQKYIDDWLDVSVQPQSSDDASLICYLHGS